ncbi:MAG: hypothetical protein A2004_00795 [Spirochaetes bacterium GWC1_61_12]|nr:MAG: hypothetical protein A2004_00795 [Spirochaetes bacterium GWC1_61_12]HAW86144.1 hypothetical protein [Spirochaetaceae bacterium]
MVSASRLSPEEIGITCAIEFPTGSHQAADSPFFGIGAQANGLSLILEPVRWPATEAGSGWWSNRAVFEYRAALAVPTDGTEPRLEVTVGWQLCLDDTSCLAPGSTTLSGLPIGAQLRVAVQAATTDPNAGSRPGVLPLMMTAGVLLSALAGLSALRKANRRKENRPAGSKD